MALDYYRLLGIPPDADQQRIRSAYRSLAKRCHPDTNRGSEAAAELFRQVNNAYRILSDPARRVRYDEELAKRNQRQAAATAVKPASSLDPAQKFSRFVNSLLDAIFAPDAVPVAPTPVRPVVAKPNKTPSFNFFYHRALEKEKPQYRRGSDGVFRKVPRKKPPA
ncbi:MAG: J domain-containing protein [Desulfuromonadales bacterium]|nr:J domain-containing protein [Desulfuromonadales bacterium]